MNRIPQYSQDLKRTGRNPKSYIVVKLNFGNVQLTGEGGGGPSCPMYLLPWEVGFYSFLRQVFGVFRNGLSVHLFWGGYLMDGVFALDVNMDISDFAEK